MIQALPCLKQQQVQALQAELHSLQFPPKLQLLFPEIQTTLGYKVQVLHYIPFQLPKAWLLHRQFAVFPLQFHCSGFQRRCNIRSSHRQALFLRHQFESLHLQAEYVRLQAPASPPQAFERLPLLRPQAPA